MQNRVIINHQPIVLKEYEGKRVVTFKDIDNVHARPSGTARKRFNDNKRYFIEGEDYFVRKTDEARNEYNIAAPNGLTLITETGYLMLVKSFTDDLAWDVQRQLVKAYFRAQENEKQTPKDFAPKYYNGIPVMTVHDIEAVSGVNGYSIRLYIQKLTKGTDYYFLEGQELARFKAQNPTVDKQISCLIVVTRSGFVMLMHALKVSKLPECYNQALPEPKQSEDKEIVFCMSDILALKYVAENGEHCANMIGKCFELLRGNLGWDGLSYIQEQMRDYADDLKHCVAVFDVLHPSADGKMLMINEKRQ